MKNILKTNSLTIAIFAAGFLLFCMWFCSRMEVSPHCKDCPSETCLCIQDVDGVWMLSPEVGDASENR
jgi:hypothetical protein